MLYYAKFFKQNEKKELSGIRKLAKDRAKIEFTQ
jgi:hypothetical protein